MNQYRRLTPYELSILNRLLEVEFEDRDRVVEQVSSAFVRTVDESGSIAFKREVVLLNDRSLRPLVEGQASDIDDVPIWITLFAAGRELAELEISKADGTSITRWPAAADLDAWNPVRP